MLKIIFQVTAILSLIFGYLSNTNAQKLDATKTLLQQLEEQEASERRKNVYQGQAQPASKSLQKAQENARSDAQSCPQGSTMRKLEDVKEYITRQEELQGRIAVSIERFTSKAIEKNLAIDDFNKIIEVSNEIVLWGRGKVTDGACGSVSQTEIIGKAIGQTKYLINEYRSVLK
jgi:hypothetical protein